MLEDPAKFLTKLRDEQPKGLSFEEVLGQGKSAAVFKSRTPQGQTVAVKVYDSGIVGNRGAEVQPERLDGELGLKGHDCEDLVQIHDGGELPVNGETYPFLVLEYVDGVDLRRVLDERGRLPDAIIRAHLGSLVRAATFLESRSLCHRDLRPDNCRVRRDGSLVVLDLGVLRPTAFSDLTDGLGGPELKPFTGALRYAPPELLRRLDEETLEGRRAVTFYQIGAVLYEMVLGTLLFSHIREVCLDLGRAVIECVPDVRREGVGADLIRLVRCCLLKDPTERLGNVSWQDLQQAACAPPFVPAACDTGLVDLIRANAESYEQTAESEQRKAQERAELRNKSLEMAQASVLEGFKLPILGDLGGTLDPGRRRSCVSIPENPRLMLPCPLWLYCKVDEQDNSLEGVRVLGVGIFGELAFLSQTPAARSIRFGHTGNKADLVLLDDALRYLHVQHFFESLWEGPPTPRLTSQVQRWIEAMIRRYMDFTASELKAHRDREIALAQGRPMGSTRTRLGPRLFNTTRDPEPFVYGTM